MIKKTIVSKKAKAESTPKANLKLDAKKSSATIMPRLAGNHNQIML